MKKLIVALMVVLSLLCSPVISSATTDSSVILVNPASYSTVTSNNLLISIKVTQPKTIKVKLYEEKQMINGTLSAININTLTTSSGSVNNTNLTSVSAMPPDTFTCTNNLSFYTKQITVKPGLYRIQIDTVEDGKVTHTKKSYVVVKEKTEEADAKIFENPQSGTMQFLQNLLKSIFGN